MEGWYITLYIYEKTLISGESIKIDLLKNIKRPGFCTYFYIGHETLDVDRVGIEPVGGFLVTTSLFKTMQDSSMDDNPSTTSVVDHIEHRGNIGFVSGDKDDYIHVTNQDADDYRILIKIVIEEKE